MKSLRTRVELLEAAARCPSGSRQLDVLMRALSRDSEGLVEFERLRSRGALAGRLGELFDALTCPLEGDPLTGDSG